MIGGSEIAFDECLATFWNIPVKWRICGSFRQLYQIYDIFEENHTAYTVSEWNESITFVILLSAAAEI